jgi:parvulin-like peptidyl-prolyl isomerase
VLRQKAQMDFQIAASREELKAGAIKLLGFLPTPTPPAEPSPTVQASGTITGASTITPTDTPTYTPGPPTNTPTKTATLPPVPGAQQTAEARYGTYMEAIDRGTAPRAGDPICVFGCPDLSEQDFLTLIIEPGVLQEKVTDHFATQIVTQVEQIHAQHILTDTEEGAKKIIEMLDAGADFSQMANTQSSEQISNVQRGLTPNGGDLGWFPREGSSFVKEFVEGAWPVQAGQYTKTPVKTSFGYHVIKVLERDPNRMLTDDELESQKSQRYQDWFSAAKSAWQGEGKITTKLPPAPVIPTQPVITEPTQAPAQQSPTPEAGGTASPAASPPADTTPPAASTPAAEPTTGGTAPSGPSPTAQP